MKRIWSTTNGRVLSISKGENMLYSHDGKVDFEGRTYELVSELVMLIRALMEEGVIDKSDLDAIVELSTIPREEIRKRAEEIAEHFLDDEDSGETFNDIFGDIL